MTHFAGRAREAEQNDKQVNHGSYNDNSRDGHGRQGGSLKLARSMEVAATIAHDSHGRQEAH